MKSRVGMTAMLLIVGVLAAGCANNSSNNSRHAQQAPMDMEAVMQQYMAMNATNEKHTKLAQAVGNWTATSTMWMYPGATPDVSTADVRIESVMDGRYVIEHMEGDMDMGGHIMKFRGMNTLGYDTFREKWVNCWIDNFSTGLMVGYGTESADGRTITFYAEVPCPITMGLRTMKYESIDMGPDRMLFRMYDTTPEGQEFVHMESVYTRR